MRLETVQSNEKLLTNVDLLKRFGTGRMMGEALAQTLTGKPTQYKPGHWFNSAKFLDIEYQTYGWVLQNNWNMKFNFIGNIKTVKKHSNLVP
jgi:hypothetical protein